MKENLRILRYNTGTDKKAFIEFKNEYDAVIFNSTIVAHGGASIADLVSMHKRRYIIDPQTHIFQQDISAILTTDKKTKTKHIKKSVLKYLDELPKTLKTAIENQQCPLSYDELCENADALVKAVFRFQTEYVGNFISEKEYDKYLKFANQNPEPRLVISPYFMLKSTYSIQETDEWLKLNSSCLQKTIALTSSEKKFPVAAQLVIDKTVLCEADILNRIRSAFSIDGYQYIFIWIDDFDAFSERPNLVMAFAELIKMLNSCGKKPLMAYGGYESIVLCSPQSPARLYGVAQSVGYGEYRSITPVGGGMPINKYYFFPLHRRLRYADAAEILSAHQYFSDDKTPLDHVKDYYNNICNCKRCHEVIGTDINNFTRYNESTSFDVNTKNGPISRNRPTTDASLIAATHFLNCKTKEWRDIETKSLSHLLNQLLENYKVYYPQMYGQIVQWVNAYERETD